MDEQFALFAKNASELRATFKLVKDADELTAELRALRETEKWQRVATHKSPLAQTQAVGLGLPTLVTDDGYDKHELEQCDVGISECDALIAQTGTVVVTSRTRGRARLVRAAAASRRHCPPRATGGGSAGGVCAHQGETRRELSEHDFVHHRPEPHRRHRTHPGPRRAWAKATDNFLFVADDARRRTAKARSIRRLTSAATMMDFMSKTRIGLFGIGLDTYWPQFAGLKNRLTGYQKQIGRRLQGYGVELVDAGWWTTPPRRAPPRRCFAARKWI